MVWLLAKKLTKLRFNAPFDTKQVILETLFPANLLASTGNLKITARKKTITIL